MSRKRLSWSERKRNADIYTMNQDPKHSPAEAYMTGDPSSWAEDPVDNLSHMDTTPRNDINMGEMHPSTYSHKDVQGPNDGQAYDNNKMARQAQIRLAQMERHYNKKALQCVKIASLLLPGASEDVIAEQALDLMPLADDAVIATSLRIAEAVELSERHAAEGKDEDEEEAKDASKEDEDEDEDEDKEHKEDKEASVLSPDEMLRHMLSSEDSEEDEDKDACDDDMKEDDDKDASKDEDEDEDEEASASKKAFSKAVRNEVTRLLSAAGLTVAMDDEDEDEDKDASKHEDEDEDKDASKHEDEEDEDKDASKNEDEDDDGKDADIDVILASLEEEEEAQKKQSMMEDEEDLDALLAGMEQESMDGMLDIDLTPTMNELEGNPLMDDMDELDALMNPHAPRSASAKKPIQSLGRVKEAGSTTQDDLLANLWKSSPDVSDVF
jgi:hypothetical protein